MRRTTLPVMVALFCLAGNGDAQERPDTTSLRFDWPVGTVAHVEQIATRIQESPSRLDTTAMRSSYRLRVDDHPRGRFVHIDSFAVGPQEGDMPPGLARVAATLGALVPSYVVSPEGDFLELADPEGVKAAADSLLAPFFRELEGAPEQLRAFMANATSIPTLTASAAEEWNLLVGTWVGAEWEVGAVYEASGEQSTPFFPGRAVRMNYEFSAVERAPCVEDGSEQDCVLLAMRVTPDSAALESLLQEFVRTVAPEGVAEIADVLRNTRTTNEVLVLTRPGTLQPYWLEVVKRVEVTAETGQGETTAMTVRTDRRVARFRYTR
ncbi:MAG TPA: hypothetical protein VFX39_06745 [Gemmatimonadaceae bacterium]|nr:hypothetical protein [Gemmatimonadaceae bacterium]